MNVLQPWNRVFVVGLIVSTWIRHVFAKRTGSQKKAVSQIDGLEKLLLVAVVLSVYLLPILYLFTSLLSFADYRFPVYVPWIGAALILASLWLFWRSHADLGQNWSVSLEVREGHQLVTRGVYRAVRHPMYGSIWLWALAQTMLLENWLAGSSVLVAFGAMYFIRTPREEKLMREKFGDDYREYMRRNGRLFPRQRKNENP
jgi:protein-S-isoprenylcysteine O-methyltransferase Ste14